MFPHTKSSVARPFMSSSCGGNHCLKTGLRWLLTGALWAANSAWAVTAKSPGDGVATVVQEPAETLAEPISPWTARRFPHLQAFQGHILLSTPTVQVVLKGVPPAAPGAGWQRVVLSVFERRGESWSPKSSFTGADLNNDAGLGLYPIAVDLGVDQAAGFAFATYVYTSPQQTAGRHFVTYRLDAEAGRLAMSFDDGDNQLKAAGRWQLAVRGSGDLVHDLAAPTGPVYAVQATGIDAVGVIGYRAAQVRPALGGFELTTPPSSARIKVDRDRPLVEGYELLLTRAALARLLRRVDDAKECQFGTFRPKSPLRPETRMAWLLACETDAPRTQLTVSLPAQDPGMDAVALPIFVFDGDGGKPLTRIAVLAGDDLKVDVPHGRSLILADTLQGRLVAGFDPMTLERGEVKPIALPARRHGVVRLDIGVDRGVALLTVRRLDGGVGEPGVVAVDAGGARPEVVGRGTWLVRAWPVLLDVLPGGYEIALSRGASGVFCRRTIRAGEGEPLVVDCPSPRPRPSDQLYADLSFTGAASEPGVYGAALGVDLMTREVQGEFGKRRRRAREAALLPVISTIDEATGLTLQLIPASQTLADRWAKLKPKVVQDVLPAFARFAREEGGTALLELGCPGPGVTLAEYEQLARNLRPSAVRLFGCRSGDEERELLALWMRLSAARAEPLLLTSVSRLEGDPMATTFPRLVLPTVRGRDPASVFVAAARGGHVSASAGARIAWKRLVAVPPGSQSLSPSKAPVSVAATVTLAPAGGEVEGTVSVYAETGLLASEAAPKASAPTDVTIVFPWPDKAMWIRAELTAPDGRVLATTGIKPIADVPKEDGP